MYSRLFVGLSVYFVLAPTKERLDLETLFLKRRSFSRVKVINMFIHQSRQNKYKQYKQWK